MCIRDSLKCASREGDLVADLMCGSGAFLSAASALGRRFFGVDQSPRAAAAAMRMRSGAASTFFGTASQEPCALNADFSTGIADYVFHLCEMCIRDRWKTCPCWCRRSTARTRG